MAKWDFKINLTTLLLIVVGVVVFFFWNNRKTDEYARLMNNLKVEKIAFVTYQSEVDGALVVKDLAYQMLKEELREAVESDSIQRELTEKYKKLAAVVKYETIFVHDTVTLEVPISVEKDTSVTLADNCLEIDLSLFNGGLSLDRVDIQNRQDIVLGERKSGLRRAEYTLDIRNTNSCIQTTGVTTYIVVHEKKWYENPLITIPAGIITGIIIDKTLIK